jgi:hypothetical protein
VKGSLREIPKLIGKPEMGLYGMRLPADGWKRSSFCAARDCVEFSTHADGTVVLRNSTKPARVVRYTTAEWEAFVSGVKAGEFDPPR